MKKPIKVSVLIPAYNVEHYIDQCLTSVMDQTLREIEIIVVDDCSTDLTLAHIEAAAETDSRIRIIRHEKNLKQLQSRKDAIFLKCTQKRTQSNSWLYPVHSQNKQLQFVRNIMQFF